MKKLLVVMTICSMVASLCACGTKAEEAAPATTVAAVEETTAAAETTEAATVEAATEEAATAEAAEAGTVTGIVTDAAMNSLMIQAEDGSFYMFSKEDTTKVNCTDGILLGNVVDVAYTGTQDAGDAVAVEINDSTVTAKADREALEFALTVINTMQFMDQEGLASLMTYPAYVGVGEIDETVDSADALAALDREKLFPENLITTISDYNLFNLESTEAGYVIGDGKPNVIFNVDANSESGFGITGING